MVPNFTIGVADMPFWDLEAMSQEVHSEGGKTPILGPNTVRYKQICWTQRKNLVFLKLKVKEILYPRTGSAKHGNSYGLDCLSVYLSVTLWYSL